MSAPEEERKLAEHLQKAGDFLKKDQLDGAEREIDAALTLRRDDLRARNLRGLLLFRAGRYQEAQKVYVELCAKWPDDAALRLNLGLVELRMGSNVEATGNLKRVVAIEPDNARAQGYLGLALMRLGEFEPAREAFLKAGQTELAHQVAARLAQKSAEDPHVRTEARESAAAGEKRVVEAEQPFAAVELDSPLTEAGRGAWQVRNPGERLPLPAIEGMHTTQPLALRGAEPIASFATRRLLADLGPSEPFLLGEDGMLVLRVDGRLPTRTFGTVASTNTISFEPLMRRIRGQITDEPFGADAEALFVATGQGRMVIGARGAKFSILQLADDIVYVRESALFAFEESLAWESGRVPGGGPDAVRVVQFRGSGRLVVRTLQRPYTVKVGDELPLVVEQSILVGWIGRVVPRQLSAEGAPTSYIECSGEGVLMIEEPPTS